MGGLTVNTYLGFNPDITKRLAGVIYSAPFFASPEGQMNAGIKIAAHTLKHVLEEFVCVAPLCLHKICRKKAYVRQLVQQKKAFPFLSLGLVSSFITNHDRVITHANKVNYPYLLVLGDKDEIVNNSVNRAWHSKTTSTDKVIKLMVGSCHELTKEPNNHVLFEAVLRFMGERVPKAKPFGEFKGKRDVKAPKNVPWWQSKKLLRAIVAYLILGVLLALKNGKKRLVLLWPILLHATKKLK